MLSGPRLRLGISSGPESITVDHEAAHQLGVMSAVKQVEGRAIWAVRTIDRAGRFLERCCAGGEPFTRRTALARFIEHVLVAWSDQTIDLKVSQGKAVIHQVDRLALAPSRAIEGSNGCHHEQYGSHAGERENNGVGRDHFDD